ncbi:hypothetical protein GGR20_003747 [Devosia subaequoris]|uniref:Antitoxin-like ribbon-helix-helix domain-containing protein n=1 Tax=Devosia subaequoris TaxID=395930 RepID=A0A7W6NDT8_9HYPH|nr:ribbon-helix-helix domain-containing protein [Devosia subaequoris]MBB4054071.1 hypothetical protein [Devosia subaequoris]MCP1211600.1 hypothetical protein [Devosia subaequoris]
MSRWDARDDTAGRAKAVAEDLAEVETVRAQICYRLARERRDLLHRMALERQTNVQALLDEAVGDLIAKYDKSF